MMEREWSRREQQKEGECPMSSFILGTGQQPDLCQILKMLEKEIVQIEGVPCKLTARSEMIEVVGERENFEKGFGRYFIRAQVNEKIMTELEHTAAMQDGQAAFRREEGAALIHCPPLKAPFSDKACDVVREISKHLRLPEVWTVEGDNYRAEPISTELLFQAMIQYRASDVHLSPGVNPVFRIDGDTRRSELLGPLSAVQIRSLIRKIAPPQFWEEFSRHKQTSFNYHQIGLGYARVSAFIKGGAPHCTFRFLPEKIPSFDDLNIPSETMIELSKLHRGLVLVTGMTGSGKTTTVAAMIDWINANNAMHILTIENPVEYVHHNQRAIISQRSLGSDVDSFNDAVTGALRHDPDVVLIGEMRDPDTIRAAINAAATGHLVISTLHSNTASEVVNRIVSFFDPVERDLVKLQLRDCLQCVICQRLVPKIGGGRLPSLEILLNDIKAIRDGVKEGDTDLIRVGMQQTVSHSFLFEQYLFQLFKEGAIDIEHARAFSTDQSIFDQLHMGTYSVPRLDSIKGKGDHDMFKS
jgi:twitching motility protein PilT